MQLPVSAPRINSLSALIDYLKNKISGMGINVFFFIHNHMPLTIQEWIFKKITAFASRSFTEEEKEALGHLSQDEKDEIHDILSSLDIDSLMKPVNKQFSTEMTTDEIIKNKLELEKSQETQLASSIPNTAPPSLKTPLLEASVSFKNQNSSFFTAAPNQAQLPDNQNNLTVGLKKSCF